MTKLPQLHLIEVTTDDVVRFCRQKYGIVPNSKVIERIVVGINNHRMIALDKDTTAMKIYQEVIDYFCQEVEV